MKLILIVVIATFFTFASQAYAGHEVGNGGDVVICDDGNQPRLLDFFEMTEQQYSDALAMVDDDDPFVVLSNRLAKLAEKDQARANKYRELLELFRTSDLLGFVDSLPVLRDSGLTLELPVNCRFQQAAIQVRSGNLFNNIKVLVNRKSWLTVDTLNKAGLLAHELIYREAVLNGQMDSFFVRDFVRYLFSRDLDAATSGEYQLFLQSIKFDSPSTYPEVLAMGNLLNGIVAGREIRRETRNQLRNNDSQIADVTRTVVYGKVLRSGASLNLGVSQTIESTVWDYDSTTGAKTNPEERRRYLKSRMKLTYMTSTGEFLVEIVPMADSKLNTSRGVVVGKVLSSDSGSIRYAFQSTRYTEFSGPGRTRIPGFAKGEIQLILNNAGKLERRSVVENYRLHDLNDFSQRELLTRYELLSIER